MSQVTVVTTAEDQLTLSRPPPVERPNSTQVYTKNAPDAIPLPLVPPTEKDVPLTIQD